MVYRFFLGAGIAISEKRIAIAKWAHHSLHRDPLFVLTQQQASGSYPLRVDLLPLVLPRLLPQPQRCSGDRTYYEGCHLGGQNGKLWMHTIRLQALQSMAALGI